MITFKYNNKQYTTNNLDKKLSKLGISKDDIEILGKRDLGEIDDSIKLYKFYNKQYTITSIYDNLDHLKGIVPDIKSYERIS